MRMTRRDLLKTAGFASVANPFVDEQYRLSPRPPAQVGGEAATISREGGRFISLIGANEWFHNPRDRWPDAVNVGAVSRFAKGAADLALAVANQLS